MLLVPGLVGGSIAGERERQTLDLLLCTRVRPWRVVIGKLGASLAFMGFLLVASLPILSVVALLGGIAWGDILIVVGLGALTAVTIGSMSILFSAISKGPTGAIVCSYVAMFILLVGPLVLGSYLLAQGFASGVNGGGYSSSSGGGLIAGPAIVPVQSFGAVADHGLQSRVRDRQRGGVDLELELRTRPPPEHAIRRQLQPSIELQLRCCLL